MEYFAGLDVSIEETAICVVGDDGKVVLETEVLQPSGAARQELDEVAAPGPVANPFARPE